jgi:membrane-bound lytic murein transglycosylase F
MKVHFLNINLLFLGLGLLFSCHDPMEIEEEIDREVNLESGYDLKEIKEKGELRALVDNSTTSYFVYKGRPMGFEYELLSRFAEHIGVNLQVIPTHDLENIFNDLNELRGDIIAANLTITKPRREKVAFSMPILRSRQVLVQRQAQPQDIKQGKLLVTHPTELVDKEVYVHKGSSFYRRLQHLSDEIGSDIYIKEVAGNISVEKLIQKVSEGEIDYTVADEHVAKINNAYYHNLHIKTPISLEQQAAWAVRKESPELLLAIDEWLKDFKKTVDFRVIYLKYYGNTGLYRERVRSDLFTARSGKISQYDELIKKEAERLGWDWRLLASLIYQESRFDHHAESWVGAKGLMQLMPTTLAEYGLDETAGPAANVHAGVDYLLWLDKQFAEKVENPKERVKFILAAYNVGLGHVFDAMRLAEKYGLNPKLWYQNVAKMMLKKSDEKYYSDEVVHYGYCRGTEPYQYVNEIFHRYNDYRNVMEEV